MPLLLAALLAAAAVALIAGAGRRPLARLPAPTLRWAAVALLCFLPLLYAAALLGGAAPRLGAVRVDYVGKQLTFAPELPVTVGGSDPAGGAVEDLHVRRLPPAALAVHPGARGGLELALRSPAPAVEVDGTLLNEVELSDGDRVEIDGGGEAGAPLTLTFTGGGFSLDDREVELPNRLLFRLRGDDRALFLRDLLGELAADSPAQPWSFLRLSGVTAGWSLVLRESGVRVVREGLEPEDVEPPGRDAEGEAAEAGEAVAPDADSGIRGLDDVPFGSFQTRFALPSPARMRLGVVWGQPAGRSLSWVRDDRLERRGGVLEVRFARPLRYLAEIDDQSPAERRHLAVVVPGAFERHEMIELDEPSRRFRGLSAVLEMPPDREPRLHFLGGERPLAFGEVYGFGEGDDLVFLRFSREELPRPLLLDLALLGLFLLVFLGPSLAAEPGLAALAGPVALLLANRLLFAWKAANRPPAYAVEALAEARLAVWLVAGLLLAGWSLAWALGRPAGTLTPRAVRWPVAGLALAAAGCWAVGSGGGRWLALAPLVLGGLLLALPALAARPRVAARLDAWRRQGVPWKLTWLLAAGAAILGLRLLFTLLGMPEALRVPGAGRLLLWTVVQLPLAALLLALSIVVVRRRIVGARGASAGGPAAGDAAVGEGSPGEEAVRSPGWAGALGRLERHLSSPPAAVAVLLVFLTLSFALVAAAVGDLGLLLVQALPFAVALLLVADWPGGTPLVSRRGAAAATALLLAALPVAGVVLVNAAPQSAVALAAWDGGGEAAGAEPVRDRAAALSSRRSQQLFRLYLLANPGVLSEVGLEPSDRVAIQYHTLQAYAEGAGFGGGGFLSAPVPRHLGATYLSDLVPMVFVLPELGKAGMLGLALLYALPLGWLAFRLARRRRADEPLGEQGTALAAVAFLVFAIPGLYMILANLNLVLFSGKNAPLLGVNSLSDALETGLVLALAAAGLGLRRGAPRSVATPRAASRTAE